MPEIYIGPGILAATVVALTMWSSDSVRLPSLLIEAVVGVAMGTTTVLVLSFFYRGETYSRLTVLAFFPFAVAGVVVATLLQGFLRGAVHRNRAAVRRVLIVGDGRPAESVRVALIRSSAYYDVVGFLSDDEDDDGEHSRRPLLGTPSDLDRVLREHDIDEVVVALPGAPADQVLDVLGACMSRGVAWKAALPDLGLIADRVTVEILGGVPVVGRRGSRIAGYDWYAKRVLDVAVAVPALVVTLPLMAVIAAAIRLTSSGPALFRQERIGLGGRPFEFLKFRTMYTDGGTRAHEEYTDLWIRGATGSGTVHKIERDPRITPVGRILRSTSLDELPQLWNVVRGDMSIVGPRPPLPYEVEKYTEWHKRRLEVPPGITGLWQVSGRNSLSFEEMVTLDVEYVDQWSLKRDVGILLRTVPAMVSDRGR